MIKAHRETQLFVFLCEPTLIISYILIYIAGKVNKSYQQGGVDSGFTNRLGDDIIGI